VARAALARWAEVVVAHFAQIAETDILGIPEHLCKDIFYAAHINSIIIDSTVKQSFSSSYQNLRGQVLPGAGMRWYYLRKNLGD
jgi:hypothetical protein